MACWANYNLETALDEHGDAIRRDVQPMDAWRNEIALCEPKTFLSMACTRATKAA